MVPKDKNIKGKGILTLTKFIKILYNQLGILIEKKGVLKDRK